MLYSCLLYQSKTSNAHWTPRHSFVFRLQKLRHPIILSGKALFLTASQRRSDSSMKNEVQPVFFPAAYSPLSGTRSWKWISPTRRDSVIKHVSCRELRCKSSYRTWDLDRTFWINSRDTLFEYYYAFDISLWHFYSEFLNLLVQKLT